MRWGDAYILILLVLIPVMFFLLTLSGSIRKKYFRKFADNRFYPFYMQEFSIFHWNLRSFLLISALFFLIISAARPQWGKEIQIIKKEGIDIIICVDVSKSMDAQDLQPSRIDRAKDQISLFVDQLRGDRIALIAFAGDSFIQCPLTDDYGAVKLFLSLLDTETVPSYGTDIGGAVEMALSLFGEKEKHKVIIIVSDGEDLAENAIDASKQAAERSAVIYTLGIGSPEGSTIPLRDAQGNVEYAKDDKGNIVLTRLDVANLSQIARIGNGRFYPVTPSQSEIYEILNQIGSIEKKKFDSKEFLHYKEQYKYFVIIALILLFLEMLINNRKKIKLKRVID
ncbi:MAG: VWA domain-containing protein [Candidatus Cloacimonetes bacterium]|nr:VWA domain-containing protein [Candidatus Cloacimonadota bacterium]